MHPNVGSSRHFLSLLAIPLIALSCAVETGGSAGSTETAASSATATVSPTPAPGGSDPSIEQQKERLVAIVNRVFAGDTPDGLPRLAIEPDARDHRQGGIQLMIEINGDELEDIPKRKAGLDRQMRDAYEAVFTAGYDLTEVTISARMRAIDGRVGPTQAVVYRTRLGKDAVAGIDWTRRDTIDFNEIWDILVLNRRWREALGGKSGLR